MALLKRLTRVFAALLAVAPSFVFAIAASQVTPCEMVCCKPQPVAVEKPTSCCESVAYNTISSLEGDNCGCQIESAPSADPNAHHVAFSPAPVGIEFDALVEEAVFVLLDPGALSAPKIRLPNHDPPLFKLEKRDSGRAPPFVK